MIENIVYFLREFGLSHESITVIVAALPILELRGSIPLAFGLWKMPFLKTLMLSYAGNMLPVIPLLVLLKPVSKRLRRFHLWRRFFDWLFEGTKKKAEIVQRYEALGLILLVAIPLPATGAWTGSIAASLFNIKFRYALPAIAIGVIIAGIVVSAITYGVKIFIP